MKHLKIIAAMAGVLLLGACAQGETQPSNEQGAKDESATTDAPRASRNLRRLSDETRDLLIYELSAVRGKQVWFVRQANDPETDAFQRELEDCFLEAGWTIADSSEATMNLRAGIRVFVADAVLPDHVSIAVDGLRTAGFEVFAGNGYRAYYDKQIAKNPDFSGVKLAPDQDFVIVVGPKPRPKPPTP